MSIQFDKYKEYVFPADNSPVMANPDLIPKSNTDYGFVINEFYKNYEKLVQIDNCKDLNKDIVKDVNKKIKSAKVTNYKILKDELFKDSSMIDIDFSKDVIVVGNDTFKNCSSLIEVFNSDSVSAINDSSFACCNMLSSISLSSLLSAGISAFYDCNNISSLNINSKLFRLDSSAFEKCFHLDDICLSDDVEFLGSKCFKDCHRLRSIHISNKLSAIEDSCFENCYLLGKINFPESITKVKTYGLKNCKLIKIISFPSLVKNIEKQFLYGCLNLSEVKFPLNIKKIENEVFRKCVSLTCLDFPIALSAIGEKCFLESPHLERLTYGLELSSKARYNNWNSSRLLSAQVPELEQPNIFEKDKPYDYYANNPNARWWYILVPPYMYDNFLKDPKWGKYGNPKWKIGDPFRPSYDHSVIPTHIITLPIPAFNAIVNKSWSNQVFNTVLEFNLVKHGEIISTKSMNENENTLSWDNIVGDPNDYDIIEKPHEYYKEISHVRHITDSSLELSITNEYIGPKILTVKVIKNWINADDFNAYPNITIKLLYDNKIIRSEILHNGSTSIIWNNLEGFEELFEITEDPLEFFKAEISKEIDKQSNVITFTVNNTFKKPKIYSKLSYTTINNRSKLYIGDVYKHHAAGPDDRIYITAKIKSKQRI